MPNKNTTTLTTPAEMLSIDKDFYDTIFAEVGGGSPEEVAAVASVFLNRVNRQGYEKALGGSSAYKFKSKEFMKASKGKLNAFEQGVYNRNAKIIDSLLANPESVMPFTHFENVNAFGEPSWAKSMKSYVDIGRQRFYIEK